MLLFPASFLFARDATASSEDHNSVGESAAFIHTTANCSRTTVLSRAQRSGENCRRSSSKCADLHLSVNKGPLCNLHLLCDMGTDPTVKGEALGKIPALWSGLVTQ